MTREQINHYEPNGFRFTQSNGEKWLLIAPEEAFAGWLCKRGAEGSWVTQRKATEYDRAQLSFLARITDDPAADWIDIAKEGGIETKPTPVMQAEPIPQDYQIVITPTPAPGYSYAVSTTYAEAAKHLEIRGYGNPRQSRRALLVALMMKLQRNDDPAPDDLRAIARVMEGE